MDPGGQLSLVVTLASRDPTGLASFDAAVADPASASYRAYLTHAEVLARFGPAAGAAPAVASYFAAHGARHFSTTPDGLGLAFEISVAGAAASLGVRFLAVDGPGLGPVGYTATGNPRLPGAISGLVSGVGGLSDLANDHVQVAVRAMTPQHLASGPSSWVTDGVSGLDEPWFLGSDFASAYGAARLFPPSAAVANATFPTNEAVATILMSGYNDSLNVNLPPFDPAVVDAYFNDSFPTSWPHPLVAGVPVPAGGVTPPPPGYFNETEDTTANSVENCLDLEMAGSLAPGADLVNFYLAGSLFSSSQPISNGDLADDFAVALGQALAYNYSPAHLAAVSGSFGLPDLNDSLWNSELAVAGAMGVTVVAASGDQGNAPPDVSGRFQGQWPTWPGTAAFATTGTIAVGGLTPTLDGAATSVFNGSELNATFDPSVSSVLASSAWFDTFGGYGNISGTEGGVSPYLSEPPWQFASAAQPAIVNATVLQGLGYLGRSEPDLAFPANTTIVYDLRNASGTYFEVVEGTSIAAPVFAGLLASAAAVAGHTFGYLDPELYRIGSYYAAHPGDASDPFEDVTQGGNWVFSAAPGWDATTGWGGLDAVRFVVADATPAVAGYKYTGPTPGLPPATPLIGYGSLSAWLLVIIGVSVTAAVVLVITVGRPRRPAPPPYVYAPPATAAPPWSGAGPPPPGAGPLPPSAPPSFVCPYCGAPRPAEPVRCPYCGRL